MQMKARKESIARGRVWSVLEGIFGVSALGLFLIYWSTLVHYGRTRPIVADEETGRIYPFNNHGVIVYLNLTERHRLDLFVWSAAACFLAAILIGVFVLRARGRSGQS